LGRGVDISLVPPFNWNFLSGSFYIRVARMFSPRPLFFPIFSGLEAVFLIRANEIGPTLAHIVFFGAYSLRIGLVPLLASVFRGDLSLCVSVIGCFFLLLRVSPLSLLQRRIGHVLLRFDTQRAPTFTTATLTTPLSLPSSFSYRISGMNP